MFNKFYKTIHNKYYRFFNFIFFLRYLFVIIFISISLFLIIPITFNNDKRANIIQSNLIKNYNFKVSKYDKIKYKVFPLPNLEYKNAIIDLDSREINFKTQTLKVYPNIFSVYNFNDFQIKKIILKNSNINLKTSFLNEAANKIFNQKNKLYLNNFNIQIIDKSNPIFKIKNINYSNYSYNKDLITGEIFGKKFKLKIDSNFKNINFKFPSSGISATLNLNENKKNDLIIGVFKSKILNTNFKFNFDYDKKKLNIFNSYFRHKDLSFANESIITFKPFLDINSKFVIEDLNTHALKRIPFKQVLDFKNFIKKINLKNQIDYKSKKYTSNLVNELNLKTNLAYGRLNFSKEFNISKNFFQCKGNINLLDDYPLLFFNCSVASDDKKKLFKEFSIRVKEKNEPFNLKVKGSLNILNNKINFKNIKLNENYIASKEDLKFFKSSFENIFLNKNLLDVLSKESIKEFILDVS